jgi:hypothetical protein
MIGLIVTIQKVNYGKANQLFTFHKMWRASGHLAKSEKFKFWPAVGLSQGN